MKMKDRFLVFLLVSILATGLVLYGGMHDEVAAKVQVVYMTAGDVNMLALGQNVVGP
jgi:hypothetical protein